MHSIAITSLTMAALSLIFTLCYIVYSAIVIKKTINVPRSTILNTFPSEVADTSKKKNVLMLLSFSTFLTLASYLSFYVGGIVNLSLVGGARQVPSAYYFALFFVIITVLSQFMTGFLSFKNSIRIPLIFCCLFFITTSALGIFTPLLSPQTIAEEEKIEIFHPNIIIGWIFLAFSLLSLVQLLNPKLKDWGMMEKTEVNGATIYVRPRVNWLAFSLWSTYLLVVIYQVLFIANDILMLLTPIKN